MRVLKRAGVLVGLVALAILLSGATTTSGQGRSEDANRIEAWSGRRPAGSIAVYLGCQLDPASGRSVCVDAHFEVPTRPPRLGLDDGGASAYAPKSRQLARRPAQGSPGQ